MYHSLKRDTEALSKKTGFTGHSPGHERPAILTGTFTNSQEESYSSISWTLMLDFIG